MLFFLVQTMKIYIKKSKGQKKKERKKEKEQKDSYSL
jgi:hypothetical protein